MGLDAYFYATDKDNLIKDGDKIISIIDEDKNSQIGYFRKNWDLQDILAEYWLDLNPDKYSSDFNCAYLEITPTILEDLVDMAQNWVIEYADNTKSFEYNDAQELLAICHIAGTLMANNEVVYYTNWY